MTNERELLQLAQAVTALQAIAYRRRAMVLQARLPGTRHKMAVLAKAAEDEAKQAQVAYARALAASEGPHTLSEVEPCDGYVDIDLGDS